MMKRIVICLMASILPASLAFAADFPNHADICVGGIVSKKKLANAILRQKLEWRNLADDADDRASRPEFAPNWRRIFVDDQFCVNDPACLAAPIAKKGTSSTKSDAKPEKDNSAAMETVNRLRFEFDDALQTHVDGRFYSMTNPNIGTNYLLGDDKTNAILCVGPELPTAPKAVLLTPPKQLRLRAISDDLGIDASNQVEKDAFKAAKPATVSFTRDGVEKSNTTKLQAALGYAFPLSIDVEKSPTFSFFDGEVVPYISAYQSTKKTAGKPATLADTNNVSVGALLNTQMMFNDLIGVNHVVMAKPQYLWNTKDNSEIASLKFIYQPWSLVTNTPIQLGMFLDASWLTLLFDLRDNIGEYNKKSVDPMIALTQTSFNRAGSKFGFAVSTNDNGPHLVLNVTETLLYGFSGSVKQLSYFDASLSYYFDSTSNYAFTIGYTKGRNEDTAEWAQTFTAGLSAKF